MGGGVFKAALASAALAVGLSGGLSGTPALAQQVELTRGQVFALAMQQLQAGEAAKALVLANALIGANPEESAPWIVKSRALLALGARDAAQRAWALAEKQNVRFGAAMAMTESTRATGNLTMAQVWSRFAYENAKTPGEVQLATRAYKTIQAENPFSFSLQATMFPNKNVNNGSSADVIFIGGLPFVPVRHSGWTTELSGGVTYRFSKREHGASFIGLRGYLAKHWLDEESRNEILTNIDPDDTVHDFDFASVTATFRHVETVGRMTYSFDAGLSRSFYGWEHYADTANVSGEARFRLSRQTELSLIGRARGQWYADPADAPVYSFDLGGKVRHTLANGDRISFTLTGETAFSNDEPREYLGGKIDVQYEFGKPVAGLDLDVSAYLGYRDYAVSPYDPDGRHDWSYGGKISAGIPSISVLGFMPVVDVKYNRRITNVAAYEANSLQIGVSLKSEF